jgi:hypothetical protein
VHRRVELRIDAEHDELDASLADVDDRLALDHWCGRLDASHAADGRQHALVEAGTGRRGDFQCGPPRDGLKDVVERHAGGLGGKGDGHDGGHADHDAQQRQRGPAGAGANVAPG